jgi:hypothetical protein
MGLLQWQAKKAISFRVFAKLILNQLATLHHTQTKLGESNDP